MLRRYLCSSALATALVATQAIAQGQGAQDAADMAPQDRFGEVIALTSWNYDEVAAEGWRGSELLDQDAYDTSGADIGRCM